MAIKLRQEVEVVIILPRATIRYFILPVGRRALWQAMNCIGYESAVGPAGSARVQYC